MSICNGTPDNHCCWLGALGECRYLDKNPPAELGRSIACRLLVENGSWEAMYQDNRYIKGIQPYFDLPHTSEKMKSISKCQDWPRQGWECNACGAVG